MTPRPRRAFAMLLVLMLGTAAASVSAFMLSRVAQMGLASRRQVDGYVQHHLALGMAEVLRSWSTNVSLRPGLSLADGPIGFDMEIDGSRLSVRLSDAQAYPRLITPESEDSADGLVLSRAAEVLVGELGVDRRLLRDRGPGRVSVLSAPDAVLKALVRAVAEDGDATRFADDLRRARQNGPITVSALDALAAGAIDGTARAQQLRALFALDPELWWVEVESRGVTGQRLLHQGGLVRGRIPELSQSAGLTGAQGQRPEWVVLSWGAIGRDGLSRPAWVSDPTESAVAR